MSKPDLPQHIVDLKRAVAFYGAIGVAGIVFFAAIAAMWA